MICFKTLLLFCCLFVVVFSYDKKKYFFASKDSEGLNPYVVDSYEEAEEECKKSEVRSKLATFPDGVDRKTVFTVVAALKSYRNKPLLYYVGAKTFLSNLTYWVGNESRVEGKLPSDIEWEKGKKHKTKCVIASLTLGVVPQIKFLFTSCSRKKTGVLCEAQETWFMYATRNYSYHDYPGLPRFVNKNEVVYKHQQQALKWVKACSSDIIGVSLNRDHLASRNKPVSNFIVFYPSKFEPVSCGSDLCLMKNEKSNCEGDKRIKRRLIVQSQKLNDLNRPDVYSAIGKVNFLKPFYGPTSHDPAFRKELSEKILRFIQLCASSDDMVIKVDVIHIFPHLSMSQKVHFNIDYKKGLDFKSCTFPTWYRGLKLIDFDKFHAPAKANGEIMMYLRGLENLATAKAIKQRVEDELKKILETCSSNSAFGFIFSDVSYDVLELNTVKIAFTVHYSKEVHFLGCKKPLLRQPFFDFCLRDVENACFKLGPLSGITGIPDNEFSFHKDFKVPEPDADPGKLAAVVSSVVSVMIITTCFTLLYLKKKHPEYFPDTERIRKTIRMTFARGENHPNFRGADSPTPFRPFHVVNEEQAAPPSSQDQQNTWSGMDYYPSQQKPEVL